MDLLKACCICWSIYMSWILHMFLVIIFLVPDILFDICTISNFVCLNCRLMWNLMCVSFIFIFHTVNAWWLYEVFSVLLYLCDVTLYRRVFVKAPFNPNQPRSLLLLCFVRHVRTSSCRPGPTTWRTCFPTCRSRCGREMTTVRECGTLNLATAGPRSASGEKVLFVLACFIYSVLQNSTWQSAVLIILEIKHFDGSCFGHFPDKFFCGVSWFSCIFDTYCILTVTAFADTFFVIVFCEAAAKSLQNSYLLRS